MPQSTRVTVVSGVTLLVVTLLLSASALQGATEWNKATTENFVLYTTANDRQARRTLKLFEQLHGNAEPPGVAIAVNDTVVPRQRWAAAELTDGDHIEIITAVQGG